DTGRKLASATVTGVIGESVSEFTDPQGDDNGPGGYTYPTNGAFREEEGAFDLRTFTVFETDDSWRFAFEVESLYDAFGGEFSPHYFVVYLRDPETDTGRTTEIGDLNVTAEFAEPWQYRVRASGFGGGVVNASGTNLGSPETFVELDTNLAVLSVPKESVGGTDISDWEVLPVVGSESFGSFRDVQVGEPGEFV
ncbi:hypothetical protein EXE44_17785, partial [Halorubrum sp. SS7]